MTVYVVVPMGAPGSCSLELTRNSEPYWEGYKPKGCFSNDKNCLRLGTMYGKAHAYRQTLQKSKYKSMIAGNRSEIVWPFN